MMKKVRVWRTLSSDNEQSEGVAHTVIRQCHQTEHQMVNKVMLRFALDALHQMMKSQSHIAHSLPLLDSGFPKCLTQSM